MGESESPTFSFDPTGREQYRSILAKAGYVEFEQFRPNPVNGYWCATCKYMKPSKQSPTGFWCTELSAPDRPNGCCDYWRPTPGLIKQ